MFLTPGIPVTYPRCAVQILQCLFDPVEGISSFQSTPTSVLELTSLPQVVFDLTYLFLILKEEARGFAVARNLGGEGQVTDALERRFESVEVVSAILVTSW